MTSFLILGRCTTVTAKPSHQVSSKSFWSQTFWHLNGNFVLRVKILKYLLSIDFWSSLCSVASFLLLLFIHFHSFFSVWENHYQFCIVIFRVLMVSIGLVFKKSLCCRRFLIRILSLGKLFYRGNGTTIFSLLILFDY